MSDHSSSVFNNSCLKLPINPNNNQPLPAYEQKLLCELKNEAIKLKSLEEDIMKSSSRNNKDPIKSYIEFFDSIPEYDDINHLPDREFYKKLEMLKEKQRFYFDHVQNERKFDNNKTANWVEEYKDFVNKDDNKKNKKANIKPFCMTPILSKSSKFSKTPIEDNDFLCLSEKDVGLIINKPPSRRSVRIESPSEKSIERPPSELFSRRKSQKSAISEASSKPIDDWEDLKLDLEAISPSCTKSAPCSPVKNKGNVGWRDNGGITIPKPFEMTVRDEENKIVDEILAKTKPKKKDANQEDMFRAYPIPIESQIPLFDKIMADQELKNQIVRERSKAQLQAQMRPFSFTKRDEEIQKLTREFSKSSPSLFDTNPRRKAKKFKAKPIPKNLFSNYIYKKMHEDEFYRALQKKIRAEEMLKAASLPPSMAKREKYCIKYDVCPRSYRDFFINNEKADIKNHRKNKTYNFILNSDDEKELEELRNEFLISKHHSKKNRRSRNASANSSASKIRTISSLDLPSVNRSNLAAVLRIQSARKRLENEISRKLEEAKLKEEARWREKIMRKKPVWQTLAYSHEEDLAMRLQLRRDEERLRSEEHKLRMQLMLGRVNQQPTLFERQSQLKLPKCKHELMEQLRSESRFQKTPYNSSETSETSLETKNAAIQVFLSDVKNNDNNKNESISTDDNDILYQTQS